MEYITNDINCGDEEDDKNYNDEMPPTAVLPDVKDQIDKGKTIPETNIDDNQLCETSADSIVLNDSYYQQGRKGLSEETVRVVQEYIANLQALNDSAIKEPLPEHPKKYEINAGNCVTFSDPVYSPNNESYKTMVDKFRKYIAEE